MLNRSLSNAILIALASMLFGCGGGDPAPDLPLAPPAPPSPPAAPAPPAPPPAPPAASIDSDKDGVADASDAAPADPLCAAASDASDGICYLKTLANSRLTIAGAGGGKLFFYSEDDSFRLYAYDLVTKHFLGRTVIANYTPASYTYSADHARLYVGDTTGKIHSYTDALTAASQPFASVPTKVAVLTAVGKFLMAQDGSGAWATHYVFNRDGTAADQKEWSHVSPHSEWNASTARMYYLSNHSPREMHYEVVDQTSGKIGERGETPYHGAYDIEGPIRTNPHGSKVLLGSGDIYIGPDLKWGGSLGSKFTDAAWIGNDALITHQAEGARTHIKRYNANAVKVEDLYIDGEVIAMPVHANVNYLVVKKPSHVDIVTYVPNDDSDGDGVTNLLDKFPLDQSASVDSDNDGHPDAFLNNLDEAQSSTGLTRDFYPLDASCHALAQGNGTSCNAEFVAPAFEADLIVADDKDTLYLLSRAKQRVYRWSKTTGKYGSPLVTGDGSGPTANAPAVMAYSADHKRMYFGYRSGLITYINLEGDTKQTHYAVTAKGVRGLAAAGKYMLAQDDSGAWETHYIIDQQGVITDSRDWNNYSSQYAWNPVQSRIYFFRDNTSPNDLHYEVIDQASGKITGNGESPYHGDYLIAGPMRLTSGGARILLGSGNLYSTSDLTVVKSLGFSFTDAQWQDNGGLQILRADGAGSKVQLYDAAFTLLGTRTVAGAPKALFKLGATSVLVSHVDDRPVVTILTP